MIYFTLSNPRDACLNVTMTSQWRDSMINQPIAQEQTRGAGAWLGSLVDRLLDHIDRLGGSFGLPTSADDLYFRRVKVEARLDRFGR